MTITDDNPARFTAANDYDVTLVRVDYDKLAQLDTKQVWPRSYAVVNDHPMAQRPLLVTAFLVAMNTLNYQFWEKVDGQVVRHNHSSRQGSLALVHDFLQVWEPFCSESTDEKAVRAATRSMADRLKQEGLLALFGTLPDPASRLTRLDEVLQAGPLLDMAEYLLERVTRDSSLGHEQAVLLSEAFPACYEDPYLKKAQLTLMMVATQLEQAGVTPKVELEVTAATDYQLPKVLRSLGLLKFDERLAKKIDSFTLLPQDSREERAIRAATVYAVDSLAEHLNTDVQSVDQWLWGLRNAYNAPFHLTKTTHY